MEKAIGIYDSGVGGLSVLRELTKQLPHHKFLYYADTAHMPYGERSQQEIITFSKQIIDFLSRQGAAMIVVACNTSSAIALPTLISRVSVPLLGMIEPAVSAAGDYKSLGLLATAATVSSGAYAKAVARAGSVQKIYSVACPKLVPLVEKGIFHGPQVRSALTEYTAPLLALGVECIILGCTHYPFLKEELTEIAAGKAEILDPAREVAKRAALMAQSLFLPAEEGSVYYYTSGSAQGFKELAGKLLGTEPQSVSRVFLGGE